LMGKAKKCPINPLVLDKKVGKCRKWKKTTVKKRATLEETNRKAYYV